MKFTLVFSCPNKEPQDMVAGVLRELADRVERGELQLPANPREVHYVTVRDGQAAFVPDPPKTRFGRLGARH